MGSCNPKFVKSDIFSRYTYIIVHILPNVKSKNLLWKQLFLKIEFLFYGCPKCIFIFDTYQTQIAVWFTNLYVEA